MNKLRRLVQFGGIAAVTLLLTASSLMSGLAKPDAQSTLKVLTISPAAFTPKYPGEYSKYTHNGSSIYVHYDAVAVTFLAPVYLPPEADVKSIILYATSDHPDDDLCAYLYRQALTGAGTELIGQACTDGTGYQVVSSWEISPQHVSAHHALYIRLNIWEEQTFAGVKIKYR